MLELEQYAGLYKKKQRKNYDNADVLILDYIANNPCNPNGFDEYRREYMSFITQNILLNFIDRDGEVFLIKGLSYNPYKPSKQPPGIPHRIRTLIFALYKTFSHRFLKKQRYK